MLALLPIRKRHSGDFREWKGSIGYGFQKLSRRRIRTLVFYVTRLFSLVNFVIVEALD